MASQAVEALQGWEPSPSTRGTFDIIWSCAQTMALCAWVSICVNLPSPDYGDWDLLRDKFHFLLLSLLGPELVLLLALTQYQSARASVEQFKASGFEDWTLVHAFYADMGGITVEPLSWKRFPVNAKQLHYLITRGYTEYPSISKKEIKARGKADAAVRLITIAQTLWFLVTTGARIAQGLAITTLELTVVGFVFCTLLTSVCWWHKPNDVQMGHVFRLTKTVDEILEQAGVDADGKYQDTPLDFVSYEPWIGSAIWPYFVKILRQLGLFQELHQTRPIDRISPFDFRKPSSQWTEIILLCVGLTYTGTFFGAWKFHFPSDTERVLWRAVAITQSAACFIVGVFEISYFHSWPITTSKDATSTQKNPAMDVEEGREKRGKQLRTSFLNLWNKPCNNSVSKHPSLDVPLRSLLITTPVCAAYCVCRLYLLLEDVIGLRSVPPSAFQTVDWTRYWPSF